MEAQTNIFRPFVKSLYIKNFKSIGERGVEIKFSPLTLLYGKNNVGKSTIIEAIQLAKFVFCENKLLSFNSYCDNKEINIGEFKNYIHNHDITKKIGLGIEFGPVQFGDKRSYIEQIKIDNVKIYIDLSFENHTFRGDIVIDKIEYYLNKYRFVTFLKDDDEYHNYKYRGFNPYPLISERIINKINKLKQEIDNKSDELTNLANILKNSFENEAYTSFLPYIDFENFLSSLDLDGYSHLFYKGDFSGALINFTKTSQQVLLKNSFNDRFMDLFWNELDPYSFYNFGGYHYSEFLVKAFQQLVENLENILFLGRSRINQGRLIVENKDAPAYWHDGSAAWIAMIKNEFILENVNKALSSLPSLSGIKKVHAAQFNSLTNTGSSQLDSVLCDDMCFGVVTLEDNNGVQTFAADNGSGSCQILPTLAAAFALASKNNLNFQNILLLSEPEQNLALSLQLDIADFFLRIALNQFEYVGTSKKDNYGTRNIFSPIVLVETHSEHILLRIMRRIKETLLNKQNDIVVTPKDISIYYIKKFDDEGTYAFDMQIEEDGKFKFQLPDNLFNERFDEIFI